MIIKNNTILILNPHEDDKMKDKLLDTRVVRAHLFVCFKGSYGPLICNFMCYLRVKCFLIQVLLIGIPVWPDSSKIELRVTWARVKTDV
uniref:CSON012100 protein n=1 Tax=Culicoides sonorensis TaxID=179676 RepID=A0A336M4P1_CULSO